MHDIMLLSVKAVSRWVSCPNQPLPLLLAFILEHRGKFIYPRYTKWSNDNETNKAQKLHLKCHGYVYPWTSQDSFIFHPTRWKSTTSHENILAVQSRYVRLSNSTICAWPQYLCCAYFQKPSLPWLFSIMYRLISPTYKHVQRMNKAHSRHELHQSSICQIVCSDALLNCTVLLKLQKFAMSTITAVQSSQC